MDNSNRTASQADDEAWLRLTLVPGVSPAIQRRLLLAYGSPQAALASAPETLAVAARDADAPALLAKGPDPSLLEATLRWLEGDGNHLITLHDPRYSRMLLEIPDPPAVLYARGRTELLHAESVAIVGSRNCTPQGGRDARAFAQALSDKGLCVVSGLALGIDAHAHRGGLDGPGSTIAVMGTGADILYPKRNREIALEIAQKGCLLTEFPLGTHSLSANFPRRNRLISGLSRGVLVVEAAHKSGSLITARAALEQNRDVFAVPGSIHSPLAKGCHYLIQQGAKLVETAGDMLSELGHQGAPQPESDIEIDDARPHSLLDALAFAPLTVDQLARLTGQAAGDVASALALLEIDGLVETMPGGRFQQVHHRPSPPEESAASRVIE